jgi:amino acid transporter
MNFSQDDPERMLNVEYQEPNPSTVFHPHPQVSPPHSWQNVLFGRPLPTADAPNETIGKLVGLAVFASDALSSTAYATQEILVILAFAGAAAFGYAVPISIAIVLLMVIVVISYEQTIHAYPNGGGAYIVARENLGEIPAQAAGAALLTDYILTVAVSISSGVAQVVSAFPVLFPYRVELALGLVLLVMVVNLRGVRESGTAFAIPAYIFLFSMILTVGIGLAKVMGGGLGMVVSPPELTTSITTLEVVTPFLLLHAFSSGTSAMTGIEAIANGITAFKEPRSRNAGIVLAWMAGILASLFLGITFLAWQVGAVPSEQETVISQVARTVFGSTGAAYLVVVAMTAIILFMAANTAFAGFPRLAAILGQDGFLPRQLAYRGSRLVFSRGIGALAFVAGLLIVLFDASVTRMIPLYAIGVFLSFTLSQVGMATRWWKSGHLAAGAQLAQKSSVIHPDRNWLIKMVANGVGAVLTAVVTLVFGITKFPDGAWIVVLLIPLLVVLFSAIHRHYMNLSHQLSLEHYTYLPRIARQRVIVPISGVHQGTLAGLRFARSISDDVTAVYVSMEPEEAEKIQSKWSIWGDGVRLVMLDSPYRLLIEPLMEYIQALCKIRQRNEVIIVVVPQFVSRHWWTGALHNQTAFLLRLGLLLRPGVVIIEVPYQVE